MNQSGHSTDPFGFRDMKGIGKEPKESRSEEEKEYTDKHTTNGMHGFFEERRVDQSMGVRLDGRSTPLYQSFDSFDFAVTRVYEIQSAFGRTPKGVELSHGNEHFERCRFVERFGEIMVAGRVGRIIEKGILQKIQIFDATESVPYKLNHGVHC